MRLRESDRGRSLKKATRENLQGLSICLALLLFICFAETVIEFLS